MKKIVLTGGPGGGKTTSIQCIISALEHYGFKTFVVPEAATLLFTNGVSIRNLSNDSLTVLQEQMIRFIMSMEDTFEQIAAHNADKAILLCDRGVMDGFAFTSHELWSNVLDRIGVTESQLRNRYDAVLHLMSAASGAEEYYTLANNAARAETIEQARAIDIKIKQAWTGHPHFRIIESQTDFSLKKQNILNAIYRVIGIPEPMEIERKFLIKAGNLEIPVPFHDSDIKQYYLSDGSRLRRRIFDDMTQYTHTTKETINNTTRKEIEKRISFKDYLSFLKQNPAAPNLSKVRRCFVWENQYFELDLFNNESIIVLEIELDYEEQPINLPPFLNIDREVTGDLFYSNKEIAKRHLWRTAQTE